MGVVTGDEAEDILVKKIHCHSLISEISDYA
jgi:hypothetical protein